MRDEADGETSDSVLALLTAPTSSPAEDVVPTLRLCQLISWPSYGAYGFDMVTNHRRPDQTSTSVTSTGHAPSNRQRYGHFIGKV